MKTGACACTRSSRSRYGSCARWLEAVSETWQGQLESFKDYVALRTARPKGEQ